MKIKKKVAPSYRDNLASALSDLQLSLAHMRSKFAPLRSSDETGKRDVDMIDRLTQKMIELEMLIKRFCK